MFSSRRNFIGMSLSVAVVPLVAGCATVANDLTIEEVRSLRITGVDVVFKPEAELWWGNAEREFVERVQSGALTGPARAPRKAADGPPDSADEFQRIASSPESIAYQREKLSGMIKDRLNREVLPQFQGSRGARLLVEVQGFTIPSAVQRVVLGGNPILGAVTVLKDEASGKELAKMDRIAAAPAGSGIIGVAIDQGFSDLEDRVIGSYADQVRQWLSKT